MIEILKVIALLCSVHTSTKYNSLAIQQQRACQVKIIKCIGGRKSTDGLSDNDIDTLFKCTGKL